MFSLRCFAFALVCLSLALGPTPAQQVAAPTTPQRDSQAVSLLLQCSSAMGAALIQESYATGTITSADIGSSPAPFVSQTKGAKTRNDITSADGPESFVAAETGGWSLRQGKRTNEPYSATAYHHPEYEPALACTLDLQRPNMSVKYLGLEKLVTGSAYHIEFCVPPTGEDNTETLLSDFHVYLDQQTLLVIKTSYLVFDPNALQNHSLWETSYSDYRSINGALFAFHIENSLAGQKVNDVILTSVQLNSGVSDAVFE